MLSWGRRNRKVSELTLKSLGCGQGVAGDGVCVPGLRWAPRVPGASPVARALPPRVGLPGWLPPSRLSHPPSPPSHGLSVRFGDAEGGVAKNQNSWHQPSDFGSGFRRSPTLPSNSFAGQQRVCCLKKVTFGPFGCRLGFFPLFVGYFFFFLKGPFSQVHLKELLLLLLFLKLNSFWKHRTVLDGAWRCVVYCIHISEEIETFGHKWSPGSKSKVNNSPGVKIVRRPWGRNTESKGISMLGKPLNNRVLKRPHSLTTCFKKLASLLTETVSGMLTRNKITPIIFLCTAL